MDTIITTIETYTNQHNLNHRFVGGVSFGGLVNDTTTYDIDIKNRIIKLYKHNPLQLFRQDNTLRDVDIILFCEDNLKVAAFKRWLYTFSESFISSLESINNKPIIRNQLPPISIENAIYTAHTKRNPLLQFVTAYEVTGSQLFLTFDGIKVEIPWKSIEPWQLVLEDKTTYTVRNPIADYFAYLVRSPAGLKPKDRHKIVLLKQLAKAVIAAGKKHYPPVNYQSKDYFQPWEEYIQKLSRATHPLTKFKIALMKTYWQTIGETLAHNARLTTLANKFTGGK